MTASVIRYTLVTNSYLDYCQKGVLPMRKVIVVLCAAAAVFVVGCAAQKAANDQPTGSQQSSSYKGTK